MTVKEKEKQLNEKLGGEPAAIMLAKYQYLTDASLFHNTITNHVLLGWISRGKLGSLLRTIDKEAFKELTKDFI